MATTTPINSHLIWEQAFNKMKRSLLLPLVLLRRWELTPIKAADLLATHDATTTLATLCQLRPHLIRRLFRHLDLNRAGFEEIRTAIAQQNWVAACEALLHYYQTHPAPTRLRCLGNRCFTLPPLSPAAVLADTFTFQRQTGELHRNPDGTLHWADQGPTHDPEWAWFLNRHYQTITLLQAYQQTGTTAYLDYLNHHLFDWLTASVAKPTYWPAQWRGREVALRIIHWTALFYGLPYNSQLNPAVRLLMLVSLIDHACYVRHFHRLGGNWLFREMSGLATIALCWPEFKGASQWLSYAIQHLVAAVTRQIYPDGVHQELTSLYHRIVLQDVQNVVELMEICGQSVPVPLRHSIEQMVDYLAYSASPDGRAALNNDSDQDDNRSLIQQAAIAYERPDWAYIASQGQVGQPPSRLPSVAFPWAGQVISRSGWDANAHWSFFDIGPLGTNYHGHCDKLHLSVAAGGRHLLVDSGRYCYRRDRYWHYFRATASHNVILIDGKGQGIDQREQPEPLSHHYSLTPTLDVAWGEFLGPFPRLQGTATHQRIVVYVRGKYWVVVDQLESDRPRHIEALWHFHPDCTVVVDGGSVASVDAAVGNLRIIPVAPFPWSTNLIAGQENPVQGWWSREYNHREPNPTAIFAASIPKATTFAWVLYPAIGTVPNIQVNLLTATPRSIHLTLTEPDHPLDEIFICLDNKQSVILSDNSALRGKSIILPTGKSPPSHILVRYVNGITQPTPYSSLLDSLNLGDTL